MRTVVMILLSIASFSPVAAQVLGDTDFSNLADALPEPYGDPMLNELLEDDISRSLTAVTDPIKKAEQGRSDCLLYELFAMAMIEAYRPGGGGSAEIAEFWAIIPTEAQSVPLGIKKLFEERFQSRLTAATDPAEVEIVEMQLRGLVLGPCLMAVLDVIANPMPAASAP